MKKNITKQEKVFLQNLGKRLKELRTKKKMTQKQLASKSGVSVTFISNTENCQTNMSIYTAYKLTTALQFSPDKLLKGLLT